MIVLLHRVRTQPKPPLCKGRCQPNRLTEGLCRTVLLFILGFGRIQESLTATPQSKIIDFCQLPLHRGALRRSRASTINDHLQYYI